MKAREKGFTLLELIVVIAGLGILSSLAIPNFLRYLEFAQNDAASAFMNALAAECLQNVRRNRDEALEQTPELLSRSGPPTQFEVKEGFDKCSYVRIGPTQQGETVLATFAFSTNPPNNKNNSYYIHKSGSYTHPDAEQACLNWASFKPESPTAKDCQEGGDVAAIRERIAAEAAARELQRQIQARYDAWIKGPPPGTGNYTADGKNVWAFQGNIVTDKAAFDAAVERECGRELVDALNKAKSDKHDGPYSYTGKSGGCSINTYLCSGTDVGSKDGYDACKERERQERCTAAEGRWKDSGINGKFSEPGCEVKWQCNKEILTSQSDYDSSACGKKEVCTTVKGSCTTYQTNCRTVNTTCKARVGSNCFQWNTTRQCDTATKCEPDRQVCEWK